jgi:hypothetical protein
LPAASDNADRTDGDGIVDIKSFRVIMGLTAFFPGLVDDGLQLVNFLGRKFRV